MSSHNRRPLPSCADAIVMIDARSSRLMARPRSAASPILKALQWLGLAFVVSAAVPWTMSAQPAAPSAGARMELIRLSADGRRFVLADSGKEFRPWGFNYDHDASNRLIETYWQAEWSTIAGDFAEMKALGANTVRVHLQLSRFMDSVVETNRASLDQLARLVTLAEETGLYLDITGLGCYDKRDVPGWFNDLDEKGRWAVQARFWAAVAEVCHDRPAVFCYDLMNEPVLSEDKERRDWTPGAFGDRYFVQRLTLDFAGRTPTEIATAWVNQMVAAIRRHDQRHLITVGAIPWAMTWPAAKPGIEASAKLDFLSLHFYPRSGEVDQALKALKVYDLGKPIVIEELFPLYCSVAELDHFIDGSRPLAVGWLGFYWGKSIAEYERDTDSIASAITLEWLRYFKRKTPEILAPAASPKDPGS